MCRRRIVVSALVCTAAMVLSGCGGSSSSTTTTTKSPTTTTKPDSRSEVLKLQRHLAALGCNPGPFDGEIGPDTEAAVSAAITPHLAPGNTLSPLASLQCAGDTGTVGSYFATAFGVVNPPSGDGLEETFLLVSTTNGWAWADRGPYCDSGRVPVSIYQQACQTN